MSVIDNDLNASVFNETQINNEYINELRTDEEIKPVFYSMANGLPCVSTANSYSALTDEGIHYISDSTGVAKVNIDDEFDEVKTLRWLFLM